MKLLRQILLVLVLVAGLVAQTTVTVTQAIKVTSSALLTWTASGGATSYNVYRSETQGTGYVVRQSGVATTFFTDSVVVSGHTYYWVVTAVNGNGESGFSSEVSARIP